VLLGDDEVGGERHLESAAEREAVDRRDDRLLEAASDDPAKAATRLASRFFCNRASTEAVPAHGLEVGAGRERAVTRAGEDDGPYVTVSRELAVCVVERDPEFSAHGVAHLGPVHRQDADATTTLDDHQGLVSAATRPVVCAHGTTATVVTRRSIRSSICSSG
jgi:hypothetical protein